MKLKPEAEIEKGDNKQVEKGLVDEVINVNT